MPRKQRFKPSRKPKPDAQNRGPTGEQPPTHIGTSHDHDLARDASHSVADDTSGEPELGQRSR